MVEKEAIAVSKFKATCLAVLRRVKRTGRPVVVTRFGKPIAEIVPPGGEKVAGGWLGIAEGTAELADDLIAPAAEPGEWEALRD